MKRAVTHACPEYGHATFCQRSPRDGDTVSCWGPDWTCPACLRLVRLVTAVEAEVARFRDRNEALTLARAVVPGRAPAAYSEAECRRVLLVLRAVLGGRPALRRAS